MASIWCAVALMPTGWGAGVRITFDTRILSVAENCAPSPEDAQVGFALPGLSNVHSHGFQRGMAGLCEIRGPQDDNFWTWRVQMYRFLDLLAPEDVRAITALAYCEMLESGFTRVGEFHYVHHDVSGAAYHDRATMAHAIADAARESGVGLTLLPVFYAHSDFGGAAPNHGQRRFICDLDQFAELFRESEKAIRGLPNAVLGVAPHSLRAVTPEELHSVVTLVPNGPIHIHAAEQVREVEACMAWSGQRPVEWLMNNASVDGRWTLIHATHLSPDEDVRLAQTRAVVGLCPVTEANLGDGVFPARVYAAAGGRFGVGTDSNICIDAAQELRALEYSQRLTLRERNVLADREGASTGTFLFRQAVRGGAHALGVASGIAVGAPADFVTLNEEHVALASGQARTFIDAWIFGAGAAAIKDVWANGVRVVENGRHKNRDEIERRYRASVKAILA